MDIFEKLYDRDDAEKWAHPEIAGIYAGLAEFKDVLANTLDLYYNPDIPLEERRRAAHEASVMLRKGYEEAVPEVVTRRKTFMAPGCPEEPDKDAELVLYLPKDADGGADKPLPVLFFVAGGGMFDCQIELSGPHDMADRLGCAVAAARYRTALEAPYPAAINDLHAGYQYLVGHAEELGIDADNIVLYGESSGTNLALSLAHRLKRFGFRPRGCVTASTFADNRPMFATSTITSFNWDARMQWMASQTYLGNKNVFAFNSPEMYPNYATPEDCIGLCPTIMHTDAEEANSASCEEYSFKLSKAGVYHELHLWGGSMHHTVHMTATSDPESDYGKRYLSVLEGNIHDCMKYDLRRQWIEDLLD